MIYNNFHDAYLNTLKEVYNTPQFYNAPRGHESREILNYHFTIGDPINRICYLSSRKTNIIFNFAEALWYLSGSNKLSFIEYYAKNMKRYSEDGRVLKGTAYGPKIFSYGKENINQWNRIINISKEDRDSKRAWIQIFDANEILDLTNIDVSCTIGFHFFIRSNKLYMSTFMRANDAYRGIVSDVFSFTFIQEFLTTQLGIQMGEYYHNVSSIHVYQPDNDLVERVLQGDDKTVPESVQHFPKMPCKNNWADLKVVCDYEERLRTKKIRLTVRDISDIKIDIYWKQVITLFALYQEIYYQDQINKELYDTLPTIYRYLIKCKWHRLFRNS
ncbi:thymidylate synthase [Heyndrickxia faecalis]|uniref:thymidylate synthase n=1 Tax=Heyndrickxia faecalis TaxID=2824910 RepID=UPI0032B1BB6A